MVTSPSLALRRSSSSSRPSRSRSFIAASAATSARSRHSLRRAAVTLSSRARVSSGSPRSRRVTAASLRRAEKRRSGPAPPEGAPASAFSGARRRPLGVVAADLVHASDLWLRWHLPQPAVSSNRAAPQALLPPCRRASASAGRPGSMACSDKTRGGFRHGMDQTPLARAVRSAYVRSDALQGGQRRGRFGRRRRLHHFAQPRPRLLRDLLTFLTDPPGSAIIPLILDRAWLDLLGH